MEFSELESFVFAAAAIWAVCALVVTCLAVWMGRRQVGRSLHVVRGSRTGRNLVRLGCLLAGTWALFGGDGPNSLALVALGLGLLVSFIAPGVEDLVLGENGAQNGWQARSWKQLEGWRLVGSHLRFLVHGELVAVEVPSTMKEGLRAKLTEHCPLTENSLGSVGEGNAPIGGR